MHRSIRALAAWITVLLVLGGTAPAADPQDAPQTTGRAFTPLTPLPRPQIIASAAAYPGGHFGVEKIVDGVVDSNRSSEYASDSKGTDTFVDFDFGKPTIIAAFKHVDRFDIANVDAAELLFSDAADFGNVLASVKVDHAGTRGGVTLVPFRAIKARYVRWQVTAFTTYKTVGGSEIAFFTAGKPQPAPLETTIEPVARPGLINQGGKLVQPLQATIRYPYAEPAEAIVELAGANPQRVRLALGRHTVAVSVPAVETDTPSIATVQVAGKTVAEGRLVLRPVRHWVMYFLPHSHLDIGYTHVQTEVERLQWKYFEKAIELARQTAGNPPGSRFKWNTEGLWAVDSYLERATPQRRKEFLEAVNKGWLHLDALYGNELTALCRPEELCRLLDCASRVSKRYGLTIDSAMISDVPGYTWGIVPVLAHGGVKYLSIGPNHCHRIGYTLAEWADRPFYWVSPSGRRKVLCWVAGKAYSWFHGGRLGTIAEAGEEPLLDYLEELEAAGYPYDVVQVRYTIGGDNGPPDPELTEFVKNFNAKYVSPRIVIATTRELFSEFERRYGDKVPQVRGDFTPYWEDGAGSSSRETGLNRAAAERLVQAEALWAMFRPRQYPDRAFYAAWRNAILYDEHTWGAHCSISQPDGDFTLAQWKIKQGFALQADRQSRELLAAALAGRQASAKQATAFDVYNTTSWPRTDLIVLPADVSTSGKAVRDADGRSVPSQRLSSGRLAFLARDVPPLAARRYFLKPAAAVEPTPRGHATAGGATLGNRHLRLAVDRRTGAIASLKFAPLAGDLVRRDAGLGLNDYFYVPGRDPKRAVRAAEAKLTVKEAGPLVASLRIESGAPGCRGLRREVRVIDGIDRVDLVNVVDKEQVRTKESVHFGFAFHVPGGVMRMDVPWAVVRPEVDQLAGACKNYFTVQRWVDVSNDDFGVTWATVDAPLVEVGAITVDVPRPISDPTAWIKHLEPSQTLYSYVMNNYWETNYKASQQGPTTFRYALRPHASGYRPIESARFGVEQSQPLLVVPVSAEAPPAPAPRFRVEPDDVIVTSFKPSSDGKAWIIRLFGAGGRDAEAVLRWRDPPPEGVWISDLTEAPKARVGGPVEVPAMGIVTLRAELPD